MPNPAAVPPPSRSANFELLRIVAMLMIVLLHVLSKGGVLTAPDVPTLNRAGFWLLETLAIVAVNCYVLISGYFQCRSTFRLGKYLRLWGSVFFYSVTLNLLYAAFSGNGFSERQFYASLLPVITTRYWYVTAYFGLYILSPGLNFLLRNASQRFLANALLTLFLLFSLWSWVVDPFYVISGYSLLWFCMLYLTAGYIRRYGSAHRPARRYFGIYLLLSIISFMLHEWTPRVSGDMLSYNAPLVFLASVALFLGFRRTTIPDRRRPLVLRLSRLTFGVYLIHEHPQLKTILYTAFNLPDFAASAWGIPYAIGCVLLIYGVCSVVEFLRGSAFRLLHVPESLDRLAARIERRWTVLRKRLFPAIYTTDGE